MQQSLAAPRFSSAKPFDSMGSVAGCPSSILGIPTHGKFEQGEDFQIHLGML